jgi:3-oxoacyl-[acyl-carrier-protein] synthase-3
MTKAGIFGIGSALPEHLITNADWAARLDTTDEWIQRRTGIRERRWLNGTDTLATLATAACAEALADAHRAPEEVDHVLVSSIGGEYVTPGLAPEVAERLGCNEAAAADLNAACAGFLYGLDHAAALIESDRARCVLVCGAEALSKFIDVEDRSTAVIFGDGAGAAVVAAGDLDLGLGVFELRSDGAHRESLYARRDEGYIRMQGQDVYRHAVRRMVEAMGAALRRARMTVDDLDLFVAHQANARIVEAAAGELGVPGEKVVLDVGRVANTSSASIPLALHQAERDGLLHPGATVGMAAFGAGYVWGAGVMRFKERAGVCL